MIDDFELMRLHVEALFTSDDRERLLKVNDLKQSFPPRLFLGRTSDGNLGRFRHDVPGPIMEALRSLGESLGVQDNDARPLVAILERHELVTKISSGPAYFFPAIPGRLEDVHAVTADNIELLTPYFEDWREDVLAGAPLFAVLIDGKAVSLCGSVRLSAGAHEAGVETHPSFRGRGLAARAVASWAQAMNATGVVPLYSTSWENRSSQALARKLGLVQYGVDLEIT
jgi:RimJ/RimL family protein N-acetyltransferase